MGALGAGRTWSARDSGFFLIVGVVWILLHCLAYASRSLCMSLRRRLELLRTYLILGTHPSCSGFGP